MLKINCNDMKHLINNATPNHLHSPFICNPGVIRNRKAERAFLEECRPGNTRINQHRQEVYQKSKCGLFNFPAVNPSL